MEAPDKIYVREFTQGLNQMWSRVLATETSAIAQHEYIRKDALLEWAKETYLNENASLIRRVCYKQLIEKLNSMSKDSTPAWSLSALWNLCKEKGYSLEFNTKEDTPEGMIEHMVNILADPIINIMDKLANNQI